MERTLSYRPAALIQGIDYGQFTPRNGGLTRSILTDVRDKTYRFLALGVRRFMWDRVFGIVTGDNLFTAGFAADGSAIECGPLGPGQADLDLSPLGSSTTPSAGVSATRLFREILMPAAVSVFQASGEVIIYTSPPPWNWPRSVSGMAQWAGPLTTRARRTGSRSYGPLFSVAMDTFTGVARTSSGFDPAPASAAVDAMNYLRSYGVKVYSEPHGYVTDSGSRDIRLSGMMSLHARALLMAGGDPQFVYHPSENFSILDGDVANGANAAARIVNAKSIYTNGRFTPIVELGDATDAEITSLLTIDSGGGD